MRKLTLLLATLAMTLLMATPAFAADLLIVTVGSTVYNDSTVNSNNNDTEDNDTNVDNSLLF